MHLLRPIICSLAALMLMACGSADIPAAVAPTASLVSAATAGQPAPTADATSTTVQVAMPNQGATPVRGSSQGETSTTGMLPTAAHAEAPTAVAPPARGSGQGEATSVASLSSQPTAEPTARPSPAPGGPTIATLQDDGETIALAVGETIELKLSEGMDWTVQVDERILAPDPAKALVYRAVAPGETELLAEGSPKCAKATPPCAMPGQLLTLRVVVR